MQVDIEALTAPRERSVIGSLEVDTHQRQYRPQEVLRLTQWEIEDQAQSQSGFDRVIGEFPLGTTTASWGRLPGGNRVF